MTGYNLNILTRIHALLQSLYEYLLDRFNCQRAHQHTAEGRFYYLINISALFLPSCCNCLHELNHGVALFGITNVPTEFYIAILTRIRKTSHCICIHKPEQPIKKLEKKDNCFFIYFFYTHFILGGSY